MYFDGHLLQGGVLRSAEHGRSDVHGMSVTAVLLDLCARGVRSQLGQCETLLRQQFFSRPGVFGDAIVRRSSQLAELENLRARSKTRAAGAGPGVGAAAAAALVGGLPGGAGGLGDEGKGNGRQAGESTGPARRHDVSGGGGRPSTQPPQVRWRPAASERGNYSCGQRRRMSRDVNGACCVLNWMHGEENRPAARPPSHVVSEDKSQYLRAVVQERVILALV